MQISRKILWRAHFQSRVRKQATSLYKRRLFAVDKVRQKLICYGHGMVWRDRILRFCSASSPPTIEFDLKEFHRLVDAELEHILDCLVDVEDNMDDVDISLSQGILNIDLGDKGCWVINKQTPNRQIWWSSPLSGPRRYDYEPSSNNDSGGWFVKKNYKGGDFGPDLLATLEEEMLRVTGIKLKMSRIPNNK